MDKKLYEMIDLQQEANTEIFKILKDLTEEVNVLKSRMDKIQPTGRWENDGGLCLTYCTNCGTTMNQHNRNYCAICGAKMEN